MVSKTRRPAVNLIDPASLDDDLKASLRAKAKLAVAKEQEEKSADALYEQFLEEERRALDPQYETKYIVLDLAEHSDRITLDGTVFFHGDRYAVSLPVYQSLKEIVARGWDHERETQGHTRFNPRKHNRVLRGAAA